MKFSIIIPVRFINNFLKENIEAIKKLNYINFEVIILTDTTEKYNFNDSRFRIISTGKVGPAEKRNIGVSKACGDVIAFLDDDAYPDILWLDNAEKVFKDNKNIFALGAPAITPLNADFLEKCSGKVLESYLTSGFTNFRHLQKKARMIKDFPTVNLFVKKKNFEEVGGFYTEFWPGEDTKLCLDLIKRYNQNILYDPAPVVYHHRRKLFRPHLKQISRYGRHRGQFARIFPDTSRIFSYFVPSLFVLGLVVGPFFLFLPILKDIYIAVIYIYLVLLFIEGIRISIKDRNFWEVFYVVSGIISTHIVYGYNFLAGFAARPKLKLKKVDEKTGNYAEG